MSDPRDRSNGKEDLPDSKNQSIGDIENEKESCDMEKKSVRIDCLRVTFFQSFNYKLTYKLQKDRLIHRWCMYDPETGVGIIKTNKERSNHSCYAYIFFPPDFVVNDNIEFLRKFLN